MVLNGSFHRCIGFVAILVFVVLPTSDATAGVMIGQRGERDDVASTPPMGWNSWNKFSCNVNEDLIRRMADAMVSSGMQAAGYRYVVVDDCWQGVRDVHGRMQADQNRFPSGIAALAEY